MFGAQYLHEPIPGIPEGKARRISYQLRGTEDGYRSKVYGPSYHGPVSPGSLPDGHNAWDIRHTYDQLWAMYGPGVEEADISGIWMLKVLIPFDVVFSTVPLPVICVNRKHNFQSQAIAAIGDAPERGKYVPAAARELPEATVICNGNPHPAWYRASRIFGYATLEWSLAPGSHAIAPSTAARVQKPIRTDCDCWPSVTRLGRYGQWKKGVLVHHAFREAQACLASL